jgi:hypothetical protein
MGLCITHLFTLAARAPRKCGICFTVFTPPRRHSQYCTVDCANIASSQNQTGKPKIYPKICAHCGTAFKAEKNKYKFCGKLCAAKGQDRFARISQATSKLYTLEPSDICRDKSFYLERAKALLAAVESGSINLLAVGVEMKNAIARAQDLVSRSNKI